MDGEAQIKTHKETRKLVMNGNDTQRRLEECCTKSEEN